MEGSPAVGRIRLLAFLVVCQLVEYVLTQAKGSALYMLKTGQPLVFPMNMGGNKPNPSLILIGAWVRWTRCDYVAVEAHSTIIERFDSVRSDVWLSISRSPSSSTSKRVFNCSTWQHIGLVFDVLSSGSLDPRSVLQLPETRPVRTWEESQSLNENRIIKLVQHPTNSRFSMTTHEDLLQYKPYFLMEYNSNKTEADKSILLGFQELSAGLSNPNMKVLKLDRFFRLDPPMRILGQPFSGNQLVAFINEFNTTTRPGFSLRWNTTYEFPDLIQLPDIDSEDSIQPCFTLILSFSVETQKNDIFHRISTFISIRGDDDSVLLKDFELRQHFGRLGGKQNGSNWQISPQDPTGQNLTTVINVCRFAGNHFVRHKLFKDDLLVVDSTIPTQPASDFPYSGQKLSVVLSTTSSAYLGNRLSLKEIRVSAGAADLTNVTLTQDPVPEGCLIATVVSSSGDSADPYCLKCAATHFWSLGDCIPQNSKKAGLNSTCSYYEEINSCSSCKSGFKADIFRYECYPASSPCKSPFYIADSASNTCSDQNLNTVCSIFSSRVPATRACLCNVDHCGTCSFSQCEACNPGYSLVVDGKDVRCEATAQLAGKGPTRSLTSLQSTSCLTFSCLSCPTAIAACDSCAPTDPFCKVYIRSCHASCYQCTGSLITDCTACHPGDYLHPDGVCRSFCDTASGWYVSNNACARCVANCLQCVGPGGFDCFNCAADYVLTPRRNCLHVSEIKPYQFIDPATKYLEYCSATCATCSAIGSDRCKTCYPVHKMIPGAGGEGTCMFYRCSIGNEVGKTAVSYLSDCDFDCHPKVEDCAFYYSNLLKSISCENNYRLDGVNDGCIICGSGMVVRQSYCYPCHPSCLTCSSTEYNQCTSCKSNSPEKYLLLDPAASWGRCVRCDSTGTFIKTSTTCERCSPTCLECKTVNNHCTKCHPGTYLQGTTCVSSCAPADKTILWNGVCLACDPNCATCSTTPELCTSCASPLHLDPVRHICLTLPDMIVYNYFEVPSVVSLALPCSSGCKSCSKRQENCTTCRFERQEYLFANGECDYCPRTGHYLDGLSCVECDPNCLGCIGNPKNCTFCQTGAYLETDGTCSLCFKPGFYKEDQAVVPLCLPCQPECATCSNNLTCETCRKTLYLYPNKTCSNCTDTRMAKVGSSCVFCHSSCETCLGPSVTECSTCPDSRFLSSSGRCLPMSMLTVTDRIWFPDLAEVHFKFDRNIEWFSKRGTAAVEIRIYSVPETEILDAISEIPVDKSLDLIQRNLTQMKDFSVKDVLISGNTLRIKLEVTKAIIPSVFILRPLTTPLLRAKDEEGFIFNQSYLSKPNMQLEVTKFDNLLTGASATVANSVTVFTTLLFIVSIPQAFVLMKVFQTIDFYIYINCEYPPNFSKLLEVFSQNLMDFVPNSIEWLADEEGVPVYPRFEKFGLSIHVFKNLGRHFTFFSAVGLFKLLVMGLTKLFPKMPLVPRINNAVNPEALMSMVEGYHMDIILGIMIHIANRSQIVANTFSMKYLAIVFISMISIGLLGIYIKMALVVHKLTKVVRELGVVTVKELTDEPLRGWLEDKVIGNLFQRHFSLLIMLKDVWVCSLLITNYENTMWMLILLTIYQTIFFFCICAWPPYSKKKANTLLIITQGLYLLLNAAFLANVTMDWSDKNRYYVVGIWMICVVCIIIFLNTFVSAYQSFRILWRKLKHKFNRKKAKIHQVEDKKDIHLNS